MASTTVGNINDYVAGTGLKFGEDELQSLIVEADAWFARLLTRTGLAAPPLDLELRAKSFYVLSQIEFSPFSFRQGEMGKDVNLSSERFRSALYRALVALGIAEAVQATAGIEDGGVSYGWDIRDVWLLE